MVGITEAGLKELGFTNAEAFSRAVGPGHNLRVSLLRVFNEWTTFMAGWQYANEVLCNGVRGGFVFVRVLRLRFGDVIAYWRLDWNDLWRSSPFFFSLLGIANGLGFDQCCGCFPRRFEERFLAFYVQKVCFRDGLVLWV